MVAGEKKASDDSARSRISKKERGKRIECKIRGIEIEWRENQDSH